MGESLFGGVAGWKWEETDTGVVVTIQMMRSASAFAAKDFDHAVMALNDRQLRSLARDLERVADERGLTLSAPKRKWWRR